MGAVILEDQILLTSLDWSVSSAPVSGPIVQAAFASRALSEIAANLGEIAPKRIRLQMSASDTYFRGKWKVGAN